MSLASSSRAIPPGRYRHFKGKEYEVIGVAHHSESLEEMVVYRALYISSDFGANALWVRPAHLFSEEVEVNGQKVPRFAPIPDADMPQSPSQ